MLNLSARMDSWNRVVIFSGTKEIGVTYMNVECRIEFINLLNAATELLDAAKQVHKAKNRYELAAKLDYLRTASAKVKGGA